MKGRIDVRAGAAFAAAVALALWAYAPSFAGAFVFDDELAIVNNPHIRSLSPLTEAMTAPAGSSLSGRPIVSLSLAVNFALGRGDAWGYHAFNLGIHCLTALVLFGVVRRTCLSERMKRTWEPSASWMAAGVASVWLLHPLQTEAVTYVIQRSESLASLFVLSTVYCAIRAGHHRAHRTAWTIGSVVACGLAMGSKEIAAGAPLIVAIWDFVFEPSRRLRWPLYVLLASTWLILAASLMSGAQGGAALFRDAFWTPTTYFVTESGVLLHYLRLAFWPSPLVFDYYGWMPAAGMAGAVVPMIAMSVLAIATVWLIARKHPLGFAGALFFLILAPTSSLVPIPAEIAAEHRMYLPLAAIVAAVLFGLVAAGRAAARQRRVAVAAGMAVLAATAAVAGAAATRARNADYQSADRLWRQTVAAYPSNARARINYGITLMNSGRFHEAQLQMETALQSPILVYDAPTRAAALTQLGSALAAQGQIDAGIVQLRAAFAADPNVRDASAILGEALSGKGRDAEALPHMLNALTERPDDPRVLRRVAWLLATSADARVRDGVRAEALARRAVELSNGRDVLALAGLAAAFAEQGRFAEAAEALRAALSVAQATGQTGFADSLNRQLQRVLAGEKIRG